MSNPPPTDEALHILKNLNVGNHPAAWVISYLTGVAYVRKQEFEAAIKPLERAVKSGGNSHEVFQLLMDACMKTERFERAKELVEEILKSKEDDVTAWKNLAIIYTAELRHEDALVAIGKANNFARTDLSLAILAGKIYGNHGKYTEALNTFEAVIQVKPDYLDAHLAKAWALVDSENYESAKQLISNILSHAPENQEALHLMAICLLGMNEVQEALSIIQTTKLKESEDEEVRFLFADCLLKSDQIDEARKVAEGLVEGDRVSRKALNLYANILAASGLDANEIRYEIAKRSKKLPKTKPLDVQKPNFELDRQINIGIISDSFWDNEVGRKWAEIIAALPKDVVKVTAFSTRVKNDSVAKNIASHCSVFNLSHQISPVELANNIHASNLDILIDASATFDPTIDYVFKHKPSGICMNGGDRIIQAFEFAHFDFVLSDTVNKTVFNDPNYPTSIEFTTADSHSLACSFFAVLHQASNCSNKQWKRRSWSKTIDATLSSEFKSEVEKVSAAVRTKDVKLREESTQIFSENFWNGFTDTAKAQKIAALTKKFSGLNQSEEYLKQIVSETATRLEADPTDNVAFYIQTIALLAKNQESVTDVNALLKEAVELKGWEEKLPLYQYWFEKVERLNPNGGTKVSAIIISNKYKEKSAENLRRLSKQLKGIGEIIFVNNGIDDSEFSSLFPYVHTYVKANGNAGAYLARNLGALFAQGEYVLFVDDDGIPQANFVQAHLKEHAERDIVVSRGMYYSSNVINDPWHYNIGNQVKPAYTILEGNAMYNSSAFYKTGGWGDYILFGHGGKDLSFRLLEHYPNREQQIYVPGSRLHHEYLRGAAHQKEKKKKQEISLRLLEAMHPGLKACIDSWPSHFSQNSDVKVGETKSLLPKAEGKKTKFFHFCRNHVYAQALSDMIEEMNATSDQQHWLLVEKTPWNVAGGYSIKEGKNASTLFFDCSSQSDINGIVNELLLPEVDAVFMHGMFRGWEFSLVDMIGDKKHVGWIIWGGDLYKPLKNNQKKKIPHTKLSSILTPVKGDADLFISEFGEKPWYDFTYPYPGLYGNETSNRAGKTKKILVGNSGDPSNNHFYMLEMLSKKSDISEYQIVMPLAYNFKPAYKQELLKKIAELGLADQVIFHEKFILPEDYLKLINDVDMLVMGHDRQQAIGNTLMGLYSGKQIFIKDKINLNGKLVENPTWSFLLDNGFNLQSLDQFSESTSLSDLPVVDTKTWQNHQQIIRTKFGLSARAELFKNSCKLIAESVQIEKEEQELQPV